MLAQHGAEHLPHTLTADQLPILQNTLAHLPSDRPGIRITDATNLHDWLSPKGIIGRLATRHIGLSAHPVRAILFDKTATTNWSLGWHQDRTIAVKARADCPDYGPWTMKSGIQHVMPPQSLLDRMLTLRIHFDPVDADNAPLLIAPGSHCLGLVPESDVPATVARYGTFACHADAGDVWLYTTPILHASDAARTPRHRRVLQIDYSADILPPPLEWLGV